MKKMLLFFISFITFSTVNAFNINIDKVDVNSRGRGLATQLDSSYKIDVQDFDHLIVNDENVVKLVKKMINISVSNANEDDKKKEYTQYMYMDKSDGSKTLAGTIFRDTYFQELRKYKISGGYISDVKTVPFNNDVLAFAYIKDAKINNKDNEIVLTYWLKKDNGEYKIYYPWITISTKLDDFFEKIADGEDEGDIIGSSYNSLSLEKDGMNEVDESILEDVYSKNKNKVVQISGMVDNGVSTYGSGFFIRDGVIVTTWSLLQEFLTKCSYIYVNDVNGEVYKISGVIAIQTDYDVAVLKLDKLGGEAVSFTLSSNLKLDDKLFTINSKNNSGFSVNYGTFISLENGRLKNLLAISNGDVGSALFNKDGNVVGFTVNDQLNSELSFANSTDYLMELQRILMNQEFDNIKSTVLDDFKENYYVAYGEEKEKNSISDKVWEKLRKVGNIEENINLTLIKGSYENHIMSLRYRASSSSMIDSIYLVANYIEELENEGFVLVQDEDNKKVYDSSDYKVVIKEMFNYLIIIVVEK